MAGVLDTTPVPHVVSRTTCSGPLSGGDNTGRYDSLVRDLAASTRFLPLRVLRSGPQTRVWVAEDRLLGGAVVVKGALAGTRSAAEHSREGALLADLRHPNIVPLVDFVQGAHAPDGATVTGFATRWVDGDPLGASLASLPLETRCAAFADVVCVVAWLHRRGLLHLDLKPSNIVGTGRSALLLDLGSARARDQGPGHAGGTPGYAAPEVVLGEAPSEAADIYGLGAVLYELLCGRPAHQLRPEAPLREQVTAAVPLPVRALAPSTPRRLAELAEAMLAPRPAERPGIDDVFAALGHRDSRLGEPPLVGQERVLRAIGGLLTHRDVTHIGLVGPSSDRVLRRALAQAACNGRRTLDATRILRRPGQTGDPAVVLLGGEQDATEWLEHGHAVLQAAPHSLDCRLQLQVAALGLQDVERLGRFHGEADGARLADILRRSGGRSDRVHALLSGEGVELREAPTPDQARARLVAAGPEALVPELLEAAAVLPGDEGRAWRGRLLVRAGRMQEALEAFDGLDLDPGDRLLAARAARRSGRLDHAERWLRAFTTPTTEHVRVALAERKLDRALELAEAVVTLEPTPAALLVRVLVALHRLDARLPDDPAAVLEQVEASRDAGRCGSALSSATGRLLDRMGEPEQSLAWLSAAAAAADREGDTTRSAAVRLNLGNALLARGDGSEARRAYARARLIADAAGASDLALRICFSLADLELRAGRLPAAEQRIADFEGLDGGDDAKARGRLLRARLLLARGEPEAALDELSTGSSVLPEAEAAIVRADALLSCGRLREAEAVLDWAEPHDPWLALQRDTCRARVLVLRGRALLSDVRTRLDDQVSTAARRQETGAMLLATAGEGLDPTSFAARREDLHTAAILLRGHRAGRAAALRDQLVDRPGASLDEVARLLEAVEDPLRFPKALARLIKTSLGAHRALIMARMPGLGRQLGYQELSGEEAAGIADEVLERIVGPDDVWIAEDAFADQHLRRVSATVRTFELKSLLAVAIPWEGRCIGALYVDDLHRVGRFDEHDVQLLKRVAQVTGRLLALAAPGRAPSTHSLEPREVCGVLLPAREADQVQRTIDTLVGRPESNLLITGPTGAGKTWFVRRLATEVFGLEGVEELVLRQGDVKMLVGQLAGVRRGDFTGAVERQGAIARALRRRKLLFLDEIQALDHDAQQVLLPLLDTPERRLGGLSGSLAPLPGGLHIVLGTNAPVAQGAWRTQFREDFWYRIASTRLHLLPLSERGPEVVYRYLRLFLSDAGVGAPEVVLEPAALRSATSATWPGNLRELRAWAEQLAATYAAERRPLGKPDLPDRTESEPYSDRRWDDDAKVHTVLAALRRADWVQSRAARALGIHRSNLHRFLRRHGLLEEVRRRAAEASS